MLGELQTAIDIPVFQPSYPPLDIIPPPVTQCVSANQTYTVDIEPDINSAAGENMPLNFCDSLLDENSYVEYGPVINGQRTWIRARITPALLHTGAPAVYDFPFFGPKYGLAAGRVHLLSCLFGGSGKEPRNVVPLPYHSSTLPILEEIEAKILAFLASGNTAELMIKVLYDHKTPSPRSVLPNAIRYWAKNIWGKSILEDLSQGCILPIQWSV